jgi:hypothetical protein
MLGRATGNTNTKTHHSSDLGEATTFPLIVYSAPLHGAHIQMAFLSRDSRERVSKLRQLGLSQLWSPITLRANFGSRCGLKQSCSPRRELFNSMLHVFWRQVNRVDSWLLLVGSQIGNLTPGFSFGHNLCFRCPNEQCEPILDIYVPRDFQWYKGRHKPLSFNPSNRSLKFRESTGTPFPKVGVALGVWGFTPSNFPTLSRICDVIPGLPLCPQPRNPFCLGRKPKVRVAIVKMKYSGPIFNQ